MAEADIAFALVLVRQLLHAEDDVDDGADRIVDAIALMAVG